MTDWIRQSFRMNSPVNKGGYWGLRSVPLTPLREKSGAPLVLETQSIAGSRVNVMDPCAPFFGDLAYRSVASGRTKRFPSRCVAYPRLRPFQITIWSTIDTKSRRVCVKLASAMQSI
jgi:hypothetical protein